MSNKLQDFYNQQATKFSGTRKKHRPEFDLILEQINNYISTKKEINHQVIDYKGSKYIVCYCSHFGGQSLAGKKMIFDLTEPNGNIVRIV